MKLFGIPIYIPMSKSMEMQYTEHSRTRILPFIRGCLLAAITLEAVEITYDLAFAEYVFYLEARYLFVAFYTILLISTFFDSAKKMIHGIGVIGIVGSVLFLAILLSGIEDGITKTHAAFLVTLQFVPIITSFAAAFISIWSSTAIIFGFMDQTKIDEPTINYIQTIFIYYGMISTVISYLATQHRRASFVLEKNLEKAMIEAEKANQTKSTFLATMSHEVRTPLNGILGLVTLMERTELTPVQRDYIETVKYSGDTLMTILSDILDFSKMEAGKFDIEYVDFEVERLVKSIVMLMKSRAEEKYLKLAFKIDPSVPGYIKSDPTRIRQVLLNLVGNAIKFTETGSVQINVTCPQHDDSLSFIRFDVADTGIGLSNEAQKNLFKEFSQADSSISRKYGGTGLGLAICRKISILMDGQITVSSEEGKGSTFHFEIPFEPAPDALLQDGTGENYESVSGSTPILKPLHILVAEDNAINQKVITGILEYAGHTLTIAENGEKAVEALKSPKESFDIVLMDMQMPIMDGLRATNEIRKLSNKNKNIPIIALTANNIKGDEQRCLAAGMNGFVSKPIDPATLSFEMARQLPDAVTGNEDNTFETIGAKTNERFFYLTEVKNMMGEEYIKKFCKEGTEKIENLIATISKQNDLTEIKNTAHDLKGLSSMFDLPDVQALAEAIEMSCNEQNLEEADKLAQLLEERYQDNMAELQEIYLSKL